MDDKKNDNHVTSRMFIYAGGLMTISGILMALGGRLAIGGIMWAAASCMFFAAYNFRVAETRKEKDNASET
ncbi:MAG: hypothetical protein ACI4LP_06320 [Anaerovoracaceae bacterium]